MHQGVERHPCPFAPLRGLDAKNYRCDDMTRSGVINMCLALAYKGALDIILAIFILPIYFSDPIYQTFGNLSPAKVAVGYVAAAGCLMAFTGMGNNRRVSRFVLATQYVFILLPFFSIFGCVDLPVWYPAIMTLGFLSTIFAVRIGKPWCFPRPGRYLRYASSAGMALVVAMVFILLIKSGGLGRFNLDLSTVYDARDAYKTQVAPWMFQFVSLVGYVLDMVVIVLAVRPLNDRRPILRWAVVVLMIVVQVLLYGMTSFKAFLLLPFVIIGLLMMGNRIDIIKALLIGSPVLALIFLAVSLAGNTMGSALLERAFFIPAGMHSLYLDYFSSHSIMYFTSNLLGNLLGGSPGQSAVDRIAMVYWGRSFSPNVGWVGIAFAGWGIIGVVVEGLILGIILRIGDSVARDAIPRGAVEGLLLGPMIALASAGLSYVVFSAGFGVAIFVLWLLEAHYTSKVRNAKLPSGFAARAS